MPERPSHILIVDDERDMRELLEIALEGSFEVTLASGGQDALDKIRETSFDAIVLDLMMPDVDGESVIRALRDRGSTVPVVLISALADVHRRARELGAFGGERKPVAIDELESLIRRAIAAGGASGSSQPGPGGRSSARSSEPPTSASRVQLRRWPRSRPDVPSGAPLDR